MVLNKHCLSAIVFAISEDMKIWLHICLFSGMNHPSLRLSEISMYSCIFVSSIDACSYRLLHVSCTLCARTELACALSAGGDDNYDDMTRHGNT